MIKIYTRPGCVFCPQVKKVCERFGADYVELPAEGPEWEKAAEGYGVSVPLVVGKKTTMMGLNMQTLMQIIKEEKSNA